MGVITLALITAGSLPAGSAPPFWVILAAGTAIALGTYLGGWRIIRTMGKGITDIEAPQGFAAEASATAVILTSSHVGFALSTTHVVSGGIVGAGQGKRLAEVRWNTAGRIVIAWVLTLPAAAVVGALSGQLADSGTIGTIVVGVAIGAGVYLISRRNPVDSKNVNETPEVVVATAQEERHEHRLGRTRSGPDHLRRRGCPDRIRHLSRRCLSSVASGRREP